MGVPTTIPVRGESRGLLQYDCRLVEALRRSEERHRTLVEHPQDGIYLLCERKFVFVKTRFEELFGITQEQVRAADNDVQT